jgi:CheY-like chemotaxis protein
LNGKEALQYFERQDFDIILMDVHMPEVDGLTATRAIRASDRGKDIPILALTASVLKEDRDNCAEAGMDGFVTKPIMFEQLFAEMARVLSLEQPGSQSGNKSGKAGNLPDLPGINYEKAILNWQDEETYVRNLKRFFNRHGDDIAMIRECLKSGDIRNARQGIHALEGVAGNLSLETFFRALESLGAAIKQDRREEYDALLDKITEAMAQAKASVARLSQTYDTAMAGTGPVDKNKLAENLRRFDQSLAKGQLDDYLLPELVEELKSRGVDGNCIDDFLRALEDFEFDRARKRLEEAAAQIDM